VVHKRILKELANRRDKEFVDTRSERHFRIARRQHTPSQLFSRPMIQSFFPRTMSEGQKLRQRFDSRFRL